MDKELLYQIALTYVPMIGDVHAKALIQAFGDASSVFKAPRRQLEHIEGIGTVRAMNIKKFAGFEQCEQEIAFIEKYKIRPLFINSKDYPQRLLNCYDNPVLLYFRGTADLNAQRIISVVGTRNNTDHGKQACETFIENLRSSGVLIVSGLAFGVDTISHRSALRNNMLTVGVLAHGLDRIYPAQNKSLARQMAEQGGLLTDFRSGTNPDKQNFPRRNRIVAGMCDALVVIESQIKGGSLITAELANSYNKDVFAFPGRSTDLKSEGCNYLVKSNKAVLITQAEDLLRNMNWLEEKNHKKVKQRELFIELTPAEKTLAGLLDMENGMSIDELYARSSLTAGEVAQALLMLEMQGIVSALPGKIYKLL